MPTESFPFGFDALHRRVSRLFGVFESTARVQLTDDGLEASFGPWQVSTPYANIRDVKITGPYHVVKTIGPARLSISDRGLTFASNSRRGVCLSFHAPVTGIEPTGHIPHRNLTMTVADPEAFVAALAARRS
jgi:hypothetical protein